MQFWPPDDEHMCSKHVGAWNKLIVKKLYIKLVNCWDKFVIEALITQICFWNKTLHVSDSSSIYRQKFFTLHTAVVYVIQVCCLYSEKRLMMNRGTVRNM